MITPGMLPEPPRILTPPSTAMVTTASSQPIARVGRVLPSREVNRTAASPAISPTSANSARLCRFTLIPEYQAPVGLLPMA